MGIFPIHECVGHVYDDCIRFHRVHSGAEVCSVDIADGSKILQLGDTLLGALQQTVLTDDSLSIVQSDAVRLSYIDQMQKYSSQSSATLSLESLKEKWMSSLGTPPTSKLADIVDPYLSQYWKLDNLLNEGCQNVNKISQLTPDSVENEVLHLLNTDSLLPLSARQLQLVLFSKHFPKSYITRSELMSLKLNSLSRRYV